MSELFPYQKVGAQFLYEKRLALLADEMGLGKTAQCVRGADLVGASRILVVCPAIARVNWGREFERFAKKPLPIRVCFSSKDSPIETGPGITICSYEYVTKNVHRLRDFDVVILDEVHFLKSHETARTNAVLSTEGVVRRTKRVWALSGTPAPNHAGELWLLLYTFGATPLSYWAFVKTYCVTAETPYGWKVVGTNTKRIPELKKILGKIMLRRKKAEVLPELPPLISQEVQVEAGQVDVEELLGEINPHFEGPGDVLQAIKLESDRVMGAAIEELEGMATSVATLRRYVGLQKVEPALELLREELELGLYSKVVVFAIHKQVVRKIVEGLPEFGAIAITGATPARERQTLVDRFQNDARVRVLVGNIQAAGTNLTLTAAHHLLFVEQDWVPGNNAQAAMRCHRIGQKNSVLVRYLILRDHPVDERVTRALKRKTEDLFKIF